jgi:predicted metal-dependent peptidase
VRKGVMDTAGALDYNRRRPNRRQSAYGDIIQPSLRKPVVQVAIMADTSGSMDDKMMGHILDIVGQVFKALGVNIGVHFISCDERVHFNKKVYKKSQVKLLGGGGTDLRHGFEAALKLKPRPQIFIVITDAETDWPQRAPKGMKTIVALTDHSAWVPGWAKVVKVGAKVA